MKIYLAARFQNKPTLRGVREAWQAQGHIITSRWLDGDPASVTDNAIMDLSDVRRADALVLYLDQVKLGERPMQGAWTEFGYALAMGKLVVVVNATLSKSVFLALPELVKVDSWAEALAALHTAEHTAYEPEHQSEPHMDHQSQ